jgi:hypothetical protein
VERLEDEDQESSLSAPVPTFAKAAKVGHPPPANEREFREKLRYLTAIR